MLQLFNRLRGEKGQALVELAFVIPIVLLFLFGIIDFGLALNTQNQDTNIANIAVRQAAVYTDGASESCAGTSEPTLAAWAECESTAMGGPTLTSVCVYDTSSTPITNSAFSSGDAVEVKVGSTFNWLHLIQSQVSSLQSSIGANATMRLEQSNWTSTQPSFLANPSNCPTNPAN